MNHTIIRVIILCIFVFSLGSFAVTTRFEIRDVGQRDLVEFISEAPLERVVGIIHSVGGWLELDPEALDKGIKGEIEIDLRAIETGVGLRNLEIQRRFLETNIYPMARYTVLKMTSSSISKLISGIAIPVTLQGELELKGVKKKLSVKARLAYYKRNKSTRERLKGNLIKVQASFTFELPHFNIAWKDELKMRVAKRVRVSVHVVGTDRPASSLPIPQAP